MVTKKRASQRILPPPNFYDGPPSQGGAPMVAGAAAEARFNYYARMAQAERSVPRKAARRPRRRKP